MKLLRRLFALACIALLLSCGGGGLDVVINGGGVGTGGTGIVAGTITGLGSVIVDGVRYDDSQAVLERRPDLLHSEALTLADLQVGQYVVLELDDAGNPTRVRVEPQLVGPAADVNAAAGQFTVWGQAVAVNTDPGRGTDHGVVSGCQSLAGRAGERPGAGLRRAAIERQRQRRDPRNPHRTADVGRRAAGASHRHACKRGAGGRLLLAAAAVGRFRCDRRRPRSPPAIAVTAVIPSSANAARRLAGHARWRSWRRRSLLRCG